MSGEEFVLRLPKPPWEGIVSSTNLPVSTADVSFASIKRAMQEVRKKFAPPFDCIACTDAIWAKLLDSLGIQVSQADRVPGYARLYGLPVYLAPAQEEVEAIGRNLAKEGKRVLLVRPNAYKVMEAMLGFEPEADTPTVVEREPEQP